MRRLEKRLSKLEKIVKVRYNHCGVFFIFIEKGIYTIKNHDLEKSFNSEEELEDYIYSNYQAEKYVFLNFDMDIMKPKRT